MLRMSGTMCIVVTEQMGVVLDFTIKITVAKSDVAGGQDGLGEGLAKDMTRSFEVSSVGCGKEAIAFVRGELCTVWEEDRR